MTKISIYQIDDYVTADDKWIGTDVNTYNKTKNFTPRKVAKYFNENEVINTSNSIRYRYDTIAITDSRKQGTLSFETEIGATVPIDTITTFILSKDTQGGKDVSNFLNVLPTTKVILQKSDNIDIFGLFRITGVVEDLIEPGFFVVTLEFLSGNGSLEEDKDYIISLIDLQNIVQVPQLIKETFDYNSSNIFMLSNVINNVLQVIVNTTSLHPEGYEYTLPSTVTILNELHTGDVITIVYNYIEEFLEVPDLQRVTDEGNHTTNDIIIDGVGGVYTTINTITDEGSFHSATSVGNYQYQSEYLVDGMSINEVSTSNQNKSSYIDPGFISSTLTYPGGFNGANISVGTSTAGPSFNLSTELGSGRILIDDVTSSVYLQFPNKPLGTYTIATTSDVIPFNPAEYDLDEFTNTNIDPFAKISDIPVLGYTPVNKAGDTMLGDLILNQDPSNALGAATKQYVDNIASGINFHEPVHAATTLNLVADYDNGISGVGATLTATSYGALVVDTHTVTSLQRVLVWQQTDPTRNGIYDLTVVGDGGTYWELTRSSDADNSPPGEIMYGDFTFVQQGGTYGGFGFICNTAGTITIGVTPINYVQFNAAQVVTAGYGLQELSPNVISINPAQTQEKITLTTTGSGAATLVSNTLNIPTLPQATASVSGYLSSTDWTTFNGKANVNSQVFTGTPSLPTGTIGVTQTAGTNNTTLATTAFATTVVANKMDKPSLTASYIPKALTATTIGNSRLLDTGAYLGIDTVNTPTKDITLGYQFDREIGIEESPNTIVGKNLLIAAGRTINYVYNTNFNGLSQTNRTYNGSTVAPNNNVYVTTYNGDIYMQTNGTGSFIGLGQTSRGWMGMCSSPSGDIYAVVGDQNVGVGDIYKQTLGVGNFVGLGQTNRLWSSIVVAPNGNVYATEGWFSGGGQIYMQTGGVGAFVSLSQTSRKWFGLSATSTNDIYAVEYNGNIYKQTAGTGNFISLGQTVRDWVSTTVAPNNNVYAITKSGDIYMQTNATGNFIALGQTSRSWSSISSAPNGNVYSTVGFYGASGDIYLQDNYAIGTPNLQGGTLKLNSGTGKGTGASDIEMWTGQVLASGTDMQISTLRAKINNEGLMTLPSVTNALIEADTTGKAIATKEYVNNRLVVETASGYTLTNADSGGIIIFTASATLTIPNSLADGFECTFVTLASATLTVDSGSNILYNNTGTVLLPQLSFTLKRRIATDQYIATGSL